MMILKLSSIVVLLSFLLAGDVLAVSPKKGAGLSVSPQKNLSTTVKKKKKKRRAKYVAAREEELKVEAMPLVLPIPDEVPQALVKGDLEEAIRVLRTEPPSSKSIHILREAQKIVEFKRDPKPPAIDRHRFYQNLGIAYHNLFLFLKRYGFANDSFYKNGLKFYRKAGWSRAVSDRCEVKVLSAAFVASNGDIDRAKKIFSRLDTSILEDDYSRLEYIAAYYAAINDAEQAVEALRKAHALKPQKTEIWLAISDDFVMIENEPFFVSLLTEWKIVNRNREPRLHVPKGPARPKLN